MKYTIEIDTEKPTIVANEVLVFSKEKIIELLNYITYATSIIINEQKQENQKLQQLFKEKKNPIFTVGTQIKFDNGETATLVFLRKEYCLMFANHKEKLDYLIGKTWEIVE